MKHAGYSLVELLVALAIFMALCAVAAPSLKAYSVDAQLVGAARQFKQQFLFARSLAVMSGKETAIRFEEHPDGIYFSVYEDSKFNGVLSAEIATGVDRRVRGPFLLTSGAPDVRVAINPGVPAVPPDSGTLSTTDPIRFGRSNMVSFSPLGTASPGSFYLAGLGQQAVVRVAPGSAKVSVLLCRGRKWRER
jgi:prepilin-type N-terminal cleavage/methylation domain-containing protein